MRLAFNRRSSLLCVCFLLAAVAALLPALAAAQTSDPVAARAMQGPPQVDPRLSAQLQDEESASMLVFLRERPELSRMPTMSWQARGSLVVHALQDVAQRSQARVVELLRSRGLEHEAFWVDNVVAVSKGDAELVEALRALDEVALVAAAPEIVLFKPEPAEPMPGPLAVESNLSRVKAPDAWALGFTGTGITVGSIDTGVRYTHEALVGSYRGNNGGSFDHAYNWRNPYDLGMTAPADSDNHGSHVTGTMTGDDGGSNQLGIAPGARWIACRGFDPGVTAQGLLACAQFMLAPTDLSDQNSDPSRRPHVVNNSWGDCGRSYDGWFQGAIDSWHAAGIYPVFSNGNAGNCGYSSPPGLNTVGNPARYGNVTSVGSTGQNNGLYANHSNWGPTDNPDTVNPDPGHANLKPQVVAPGVSIRSATRGSDSSYASFTGTSMSAPHVAGLVALVWQAGPCLVGQYSTTEIVLESAVNPVPYATNHGSEGPGNVPNHATGWGEIDALAAVTMAQALCTDVGTLSGTVTEAGSGQPLAGAMVTILGSGLPSLKATTDAAGFWSRQVPAGTYEIAVSLYAYAGAEAVGIEVVADQTTVVDLQLEALPESTISGVVVDAGPQGWPLYARIDIAGHPGSPVFTDPVSGAYSVTLLEGESYDFSVTALTPGWSPQYRSVVPPPGGGSENFLLALDVANCSAPGYAVDYVYFENFDSSDGGYTVSGASTWQFGEPSSGPGAAVSAPNVWATNLSGPYNNGENGYLTSPAIDLSAHAGSTPVLHWRQWLRTEGGFDFASVEASSDGGATWVRVYGEASGDVDLGWSLRSVPLDPSYATAGFRLRFRFRSDGTVVREGWYIDNVGVGISDYAAGAELLFQSFEDAGFPPGGWTRHNLDGAGTQWVRSTTRAFHGTASAAHSYSVVGNQDGWLVAPAVALPAGGAALGFVEYTAFPSFYGKHSLWVCTADCAAPPTNYAQVAEFGAPVSQWRTQTVSLHAFAGLTVNLAFRYEGNDAADWFIDAVRVSEPASGSTDLPCNPTPGGMLVGLVSDLNTGAHLVGAAVRDAASGVRATTVATPADPGLADGFYQLFVPTTGPAELTASLARYADAEALVEIVPGTLARHDFALAAARLELAPAAVSVRIPLTHGGSLPVDLHNSGTAAADFVLTEYVGHGAVYPHQGRADALDLEHPPKSPQDPGLITLQSTLAGPTPGVASGLAGSAMPAAWAPIPDMPVGVARVATAVVEGKLYLLGGQSSGGLRIGRTQVYDPASGTWDDSLPGMPVPTDNNCAGVIDGRIYVPGGTTGGDTFVAALQVFDPGAGAWSSEDDDPLPQPRLGHACAVLDGKLYLFGGTLDGAALTASALVYDPAAVPGTRWSSIADMPLATLFGAATAADGKVFTAAFRSASSLNSPAVIAYDPVAGEWVNYPNLQVGRGEGAMWSVGERLYVGAGGVGTYLRSVEAYDLSAGTSGSWSAVGQAGQGRQAPGYATDAAGGMLYLVGGYDGAFKASGEVNRVAIDVPWLSQTPAGGVLPAQGSAGIDLHFDAGALPAGTYLATLVADNDGPYAPPTLLVTMEVVDAAPTVDAVLPAVGPVTGGQSITISGENFFLAYAGATEVLLGAEACLDTVVVDSETITCTTPAQAAGSVDVRVTNPGGQSGVLADGFRYTELAPALVAVAPAQGPVAGGTLVTLTGSNFLTAGTTLVSFGTEACTEVTVIDGGSITCVTPAHAAGAVDVTVTNPDGQSAVLVDGFTYVAPAPVLTSVSPEQGFTTGGTPVTLTGSHFQLDGTTVVQFGGAACIGVVAVDSETLTCTTPAHAAGAVDVAVTNPDGQSTVLTAGFTYLPTADAIFGNGFE